MLEERIGWTILVLAHSYRRTKGIFQNSRVVAEGHLSGGSDGSMILGVVYT